MYTIPQISQIMTAHRGFDDPFPPSVYLPLLFPPPFLPFHLRLKIQRYDNLGAQIVGKISCRKSSTCSSLALLLTRDSRSNQAVPFFCPELSSKKKGKEKRRDNSVVYEKKQNCPYLRTMNRNKWQDTFQRRKTARAPWSKDRFRLRAEAEMGRRGRNYARHYLLFFAG